MLPVLLAIAAAFFYGVSNVFIRKGLEHSNPDSSVVVSFVVNAVTLVVFAAFFSFSLSLLALAVLVIAGLMAPGLSRMLRYRSLERIGIARTGPISAASPIISTLIAVLFFHENVTLAVIIGTVLVILGVVYTSGKDFLGANRSDFIFAACGAFFVGVATPLRKWGVDLSSPMVASAITVCAACILALSIVGANNGLSRVDFGLRSKWFYVAGLSLTVAFIFNFSALAKGTISVIAPILQITPIFALFFSHIFIRHLENITGRIWVGTVIVVAGCVLIVL